MDTYKTKSGTSQGFVNADFGDSESRISVKVTEPESAEEALELPETKPNPEKEKTELQLNIQIGEHLLTASLAQNTSAEALAEMLSGGPVSIQMQDYARMEKVGPLPVALPQNDETIHTEAGDLILYQGSSFVIYYDENTWSLTWLGKIDGITKQELKDILGDAEVTAVLSLPST
ncbi:MAG: hypothetical protein HFK04_01855 [Oscillospiraceae bacterium]|nr:hypothetical protein [Oscillospiraceae bacterium]